MIRLLLICGLALMLVPAALAGPTLGTPTVAVSPSSVILDSPFTISGCGYRANEELWLGTVLGGAFTVADSAGCFSVVWLWDVATYGKWAPGTFDVISYDASNGHIKSKALAHAWFTIALP